MILYLIESEEIHFNTRELWYWEVDEASNNVVCLLHPVLGKDDEDPDDVTWLDIQLLLGQPYHTLVTLVLTPNQRDEQLSIFILNVSIA